ncbi:MAG: hypothetical protein WC135_06450 [Bacteroidales bacterium]
MQKFSLYFYIIEKVLSDNNDKITKQIAVGMGINYNRGSSYMGTSAAGLDYYDTRSMFAVTPSAIYGIKITDNFTYIPRLYISFGFGSLDSESVVAGQIATTTEDLSNIAIGVKPISFEYAINKRFAITMSFGDLYYMINTQKATIGGTEVKVADKSFNLNANYGATFGLRLYL